MRVPYKGLVIAGLPILLVTSLGAKYLVDRARLPRVWARTVPYDPNMPIRGRYVSLQLEVQLPPGTTVSEKYWSRPADLEIANGQLMAVPRDGESRSNVYVTWGTINRPPSVSPGVAVILEPVAFFIPEHNEDPSRRLAGEELWAEVSIPRHGPPRPIRLAIKKDGIFTPLNFD